MLELLVGTSGLANLFIIIIMIIFLIEKIYSKSHKIFISFHYEFLIKSYRNFAFIIPFVP